MQSRILVLQRRIDRFTEACGRCLSWLSLAMMLLTLLVVICRYLFNLGWIALQESVLYLHAAGFMLGAAWTLKHDGHVRVDIFYRRFSRRAKAWVDLLGAVLLLMPVCLFIFWISLDYVLESWRVLEGSPEAGGLPGVFLLKSLLLLLPTLLLLQGIAEICRQSLRLWPRDTPGRQQGKGDLPQGMTREET